jgi:purine nucleosidase
MSSEPLPLVLDTDIGDDIDDAWALSVCINHPAIRLVGVTTVWRDTELRAAQARLLLEKAGVADVPVAAGARDGLDRLLDFPRNCQADVLSAEDEARLRPGRCDAVRMLAELADSVPGLVVAPVGPLTNVARFICEYPKAFAKIDRLVIMGGHMMADRPNPEYNVYCDPRASQIVFSCGKPIQMIGLDVTLRCQMQPGDLEAIEAKKTPLSDAIMTMTRLWQGAGDGRRKLGMPVVHDPLAVLTAVEPELVQWETRRVAIDDRGNCVASDCGGLVQVAIGVEPDPVRRRVVELIG